jgi:hypothetical protein
LKTPGHRDFIAVKVLAQTLSVVCGFTAIHYVDPRRVGEDALLDVSTSGVILDPSQGVST